jgi:transposase
MGPALRVVLRVAQGRPPQPSAAIFDRRTVQAPPDRGTRAGYDGAKRRRGSQVPLAVDTLRHLLALHVTAAHAQDRRQGTTLAAQAAEAHQMPREVVTLPAAKTGGVLRPKRWVGERSNAWAARFRRVARDYEQLAETLAGLHVVAFALLMRKRLVELIVSSA